MYGLRRSLLSARFSRLITRDAEQPRRDATSFVRALRPSVSRYSSRTTSFSSGSSEYTTSVSVCLRDEASSCCSGRIP